jgi:formylglycine-generating enzyme required for sulfatase activity
VDLERIREIDGTSSMARYFRFKDATWISLANRIGGGGEGEVWTVSERSDLVAKIYHRPDKTPRRKLLLMLDNPPSDPMAGQGHSSIAWPVDILCERYGGPPLGYLMPLLSEMMPIHRLYNPRDRLDTAPEFSYRYLWAAATNLSSAVAALHAKNYVIGDVNQSNVLVKTNTYVSLVDCDSFQVHDSERKRHIRCPVFTPEFTPPELQGKNVSELDRTSNHDLFGLAVLIFQLLMEGSHPFRARYLASGEAPSLDERIRLGLFPHGTSRHPSVEAPPGSLPFDFLPPELQSLFRLAFASSAAAVERPTATEWKQSLRQSLDSLVQCGINGQHEYPSHIGDCPWCARAAVLGRDPFPAIGTVRSRPRAAPASRPVRRSPNLSPRASPPWAPISSPRMAPGRSPIPIAAPPQPRLPTRVPSPKLWRRIGAAPFVLFALAIAIRVSYQGRGPSHWSDEEVAREEARESDTDDSVAPVLPMDPSHGIPGFTFTAKNPQGHAEYRHDASEIVFVLIPGGEFEMGSPESEAERRSNERQHRVTLSPYLIAKKELSQGEWERVMGTTPSSFGPDDALPVENVSWNDCVELFAKLNGWHDGRAPSILSFRFPTEAQWEYACRAGTQGPFSFGANITTAEVNYDGDHPYAGGATGLDRQKTLATGSLPANGYGLHEMHGNVWEWCFDVYDVDFYSSSAARGPDPLATSGSDFRVLRGGSWSGLAWGCRSSLRLWDAPDSAGDNIGVRPAFFPLPSDFPLPSKVDTAFGSTVATLPTTGPTSPDVLAPTLSIDTPVDNATLSAGLFLVRGSASDDREVARVSVNGKAATIAGSSWSVYIDGAEGLLELEATAVDAAGNVGTATRGVRLSVTDSWPSGERQIPDFTFTRRNPQGHAEYRHDASGIVFVLIPGGEFEMGSPENEAERDSDETPHRVTLSPYLIAKKELSQGEWKRVMGTTSTSSYFDRDDALPVEQISWDDCVEFIAKLNSWNQGEKPSTPSFWFPTEAQWEFACRAGTKGPFSFGANITTAEVNYDGEHPYAGGATGLDRQRTVATGSLPANGYGLHEMHGNVWEWCADVYVDGFYSSSTASGLDPLSTSGSVHRVIRGGSWLGVAKSCRSAYRGWLAPGLHGVSIGLRPAFSPLP